MEQSAVVRSGMLLGSRNAVWLQVRPEQLGDVL
jgi:hypothetical protein